MQVHPGGSGIGPQFIQRAVIALGSNVKQINRL